MQDQASVEYPEIKLKRGKDQSIQRKHPWIFSGAIQNDISKISDGELVQITDFDGKFLGIGMFQFGSISIKILSFHKQIIDLNFFRDKISKCLEFRKNLNLFNNPNTNVFRLVFGEADGLPGLIIDYYNGHCVIQCHSIGMHLQLNHIQTALKEVLKENVKSIYDKSKEALPNSYAEKIENRILEGNETHTLVTENNHQFFVDWEKGQKTGFFIDQRENRMLLSQFTKDKSVLNTFSYTGGFSVYAGASGAKKITSVDISAPAISIAEKNSTLNNLTNHEAVTADVFDYLKSHAHEYDVIILDPPAFAKNKSSKHNAVIGYKRLNAIAMKKIKPGGILFTFSCSQVIDKSLFFHTLSSAAFEANRSIKIIQQLHQPPDHPISLSYPEGEYLKGYIFQVE